MPRDMALNLPAWLIKTDANAPSTEYDTRPAMLFNPVWPLTH
jgi:hypothetical protein